MVAATIDFANVLDNLDLHRHDFKVLADFLAKGTSTAATGASQLITR